MTEPWFERKWRVVYVPISLEGWILTLTTMALFAGFMIASVYTTNDLWKEVFGWIAFGVALTAGVIVMMRVKD